MEEEKIVRTDILYFETRERIFEIQDKITKMIDYNLEHFRKLELHNDTNIYLNNALQLSTIYKNLGG